MGGLPEQGVRCGVDGSEGVDTTTSPVYSFYCCLLSRLGVVV